MRFASIYLSNYIGIYNGMGLYDIHIDMTKCKNRITIIRGDNGSGKSTLSKAMNLFPDPNDSFIPGMPARKEIILVDGDVFYKLVFIHGIKANGDRDTTKAYITKTFNGTAIELNENGNVTSYKDILYSELGLDANFAALSQLSNDDRGLADKRPAERKRFVGSIISSLDIYNGIYKTLTKRSSNFKSMINSITAKLGVLGDEESITANLEAVELKINGIQDQKDQAVVALAREQQMISLLDPDGTIQSTNASVSAELDEAEKEYGKIQSIIESLISSNGIGIGDIESDYKRVVDRKNSLIIDNQLNRNTLDGLIAQKEAQAAELEQKIHRLSQLRSGESYEAILEKFEGLKGQIVAIKSQLMSIGIQDVANISKEEYILALETLKDLESYISSFKSCIYFTIIESIVRDYMSTGQIPPPKDASSNEAAMRKMEADINDLKHERSMICSKLDLLDKLSMRPDTCTDNSCLFIKDAVEFANTNPRARIEVIDIAISRIEDSINANRQEYAEILAYNDAVNKFAIIVREVNRNAAILSKMPNGNMFSNKMVFFERLLSGYGFEYMSAIYQYIDLANLFDTYRHLESICQKYEAELLVYESKAESIAAVQEDIDRINIAISGIVDKINPINAEMLDISRDIAVLQELEGVYAAIIDNMAKQKPIAERIKVHRATLLENSRKMNEINAALTRSISLRETISKCSQSLVPLMRERDSLNHSVQMMKDYKRELEELQANYEYIETIKYYSSPTTGIQIVFMELYMGKIMSLANELLKLLFNGQFVIQPPIINDSEFRIPCLGGGYINDDISSMSSSQIGMISMILSFALLHHSSTKYNIIKLDEIDGPLDFNNRMYFMDVLNSIMDIMHAEQCIMISHNAELQVDNSDVILLRHDKTNMDYQRGNIIWSY